MHTRRVLIATAVLLVVVLAAAVPTAHAQQRIHVVQPGETLYGIARLYGVTIQQIAAANGIVNPNILYVGQRLVIPGGEPPPSGSTTTYVVQRGDTLYGIASRFNTTITMLVQLNGIANPNLLYVGQVLVVPAPGGAPTSTPVPQQPTATPQPGASATPTPQQAPPTPVPSPVTHVVQRGETLSAIALRYGVTIQQIVALNNIANPNLIYVGQVLVIRPGPTPPPPTATPTRTPTATRTPGPSPTAGTPTPLPDGINTPTPIVQAQAVPQSAVNLLADPGFEGQLRDVDASSVRVVTGWQPFYCAEPYTGAPCPAPRQGSGNPAGAEMIAPTFSAASEASRVRSGSSAQSWSCRYGSCQGGVYQVVQTRPGDVCEAGAYVQSVSSNAASGASDLASEQDRANSTWRIRVDLTGGEDAFRTGEGLLVSEGFGYYQNIYDRYAPITYTFMATGSATTVFFEDQRLWPFARNVSYIDDAYVRCVTP